MEPVAPVTAVSAARNLPIEAGGLAAGTVVRARVAGVDGDVVRLRWGEQMLSATSRVPLAVGQQVRMVVEDDGGGTMLLKMVDDTFGRGHQEGSGRPANGHAGSGDSPASTYGRGGSSWTTAGHGQNPDSATLGDATGSTASAPGRPPRPGDVGMPVGGGRDSGGPDGRPIGIPKLATAQPGARPIGTPIGGTAQPDGRPHGRPMPGTAQPGPMRASGYPSIGDAGRAIRLVSSSVGAPLGTLGAGAVPTAPPSPAAPGTVVASGVGDTFPDGTGASNGTLGAEQRYPSGSSAPRSMVDGSDSHFEPPAARVGRSLLPGGQAASAPSGRSPLPGGQPTSAPGGGTTSATNAGSAAPPTGSGRLAELPSNSGTRQEVAITQLATAPDTQEPGPLSVHPARIAVPEYGRLVQLADRSHVPASMLVAASPSLALAGRPAGSDFLMVDVPALLAQLHLPADDLSAALVGRLVAEGTPLSEGTVRDLRRGLARLGGTAADAGAAALLSRLGLPLTVGTLEIARRVASGRHDPPASWREALGEIQHLAATTEGPSDPVGSLARELLRNWTPPSGEHPSALARWLRTTVEQVATPPEARLAPPVEPGAPVDPGVSEDHAAVDPGAPLDPGTPEDHAAIDRPAAGPEDRAPVGRPPTPRISQPAVGPTPGRWWRTSGRRSSARRGPMAPRLARSTIFRARWSPSRR